MVVRVEASPRSDTTGSQSDQDGVDETLYLIGRPTLKRFIRFVRGRAVNPPSEGALAEEWQAAHGLVRTLEGEEAGLADDPPLARMGSEYESRS